MFCLVLPVVLAAASLVAAPTAYDLDPAHSSAQFTARHMMITNVKGTFQKMSGHAVWDPNNLAASKLEASIDVNSISTQQAKRDAHLKSPDFFDVEKYPTMTFRSTTFRKNSSGGLEMVGDLTIHGITKQVVFAVEGPTAEIKDGIGGRLGAAATTKISRKEFGLLWNKLTESGGMVVADEIQISIEAEFVKKK